MEQEIHLTDHPRRPGESPAHLSLQSLVGVNRAGLNRTRTRRRSDRTSAATISSVDRELQTERKAASSKAEGRFLFIHALNCAAIAKLGSATTTLDRALLPQQTRRSCPATDFTASGSPHDGHLEDHWLPQAGHSVRTCWTPSIDLPLMRRSRTKQHFELAQTRNLYIRVASLRVGQKYASSNMRSIQYYYL